MKEQDHSDLNQKLLTHEKYARCFCIMQSTQQTSFDADASKLRTHHDAFTPQMKSGSTACELHLKSVELVPFWVRAHNRCCVADACKA
jgi:hypothetical protein